MGILLLLPLQKASIPFVDSIVTAAAAAADDDDDGDDDEDDDEGDTDEST